MATNAAAALRALSQLGCVPALRGFTGAQAHLGGFSLWNSHFNSILSFQLQIVERLPGI